MRFHQFQNIRGGMIAIDLDAVWGVCPLGGNETTIYAGGGCFSVKGAVEDVLALISPPALPDTFEEDLAAHMAKLREQGGQGPLNMAPPPVSVDISEALSQGERRCRLDELDRLMNMFKDPFGFNPVTRYVDARRRELEA